MSGSYFLLISLIILPLVCALVCCFVNNLKIRSIITGFISFVLLTSVAGVIQQLAKSGGKISIIVMSPPFDVNWIMELARVFLPLYFIYLGIKMKKIPIIVLSTLQIVMTVLFEVFTDIKVSTVTITVNYMSVSMMLLITTIISFAVFIAARYVNILEVKLGIKGRAQSAFLALLFIFSGALNNMAASDNILWLPPFWGVTALCSFLLISLVSGRMDDSNAVQLLYINLAGSVLFVFATILVYKTTGLLALEDISASVPYGKLLCLLPQCMALISFAGFIRVVLLKLKRG